MKKEIIIEGIAYGLISSSSPIECLSEDFIFWKNNWYKKKEVKPFYTILSLKKDKYISSLRSNGLYLNDLQSGLGSVTLEAALNPAYGWTIYSVRRESDGEIFTIGDNTECGIVIGFTIKEDRILVKFDMVGRNCFLDATGGLKKVPKREKIFTTDSELIDVKLSKDQLNKLLEILK
jgi:hypothetical protein